ncbi:MAG TPA: choice-of-anchor L domain-containing protein, partial [bacterium]|nr:choice-of-anchor L domain-containing protein [bacterium]
MALPALLHAAITVVESGPGLSAANMAADLVGGGVAISNATYTGASVAAGTFSGGAGIVDFDAGVVLSTGAIDNIVGPNLGNASVDNN